MQISFHFFLLQPRDLSFESTHSSRNYRRINWYEKSLPIGILSHLIAILSNELKVRCEFNREIRMK